MASPHPHSAKEANVLVPRSRLVLQRGTRFTQFVLLGHTHPFCTLICRRKVTQFLLGWRTIPSSSNQVLQELPEGLVDLCLKVLQRPTISVLLFSPQVEERKDFHKETSASINTNVRVPPSLTGSSELCAANSLEDLMVLESRARPQTRDTHRKLRHIHILPTVDRLPLYRLITVSSFCLSLSYVCLQPKKNQH